jgi:agmatine/peptidylarginine deiminase
MPPHAEDHFGGTYTNVVYANGVLLVPTWPEASKEVERRALDVFRRLLPEWTIKKFDSHELGVMEGGPRCATLSLFRLKASARTPKNEDSQVEF